VSLAFLSIYMAVWAVLVWAGLNSYGIKRLPKAAQLFMDGFVAFDRWILAAKTAPKHGRASARTNYGISVPTGFRCPSASGLSYRASRNTKILTLRIFAEINLNRADLYRDTFMELAWSF
jgi:hypothetical protein